MKTNINGASWWSPMLLLALLACQTPPPPPAAPAPQPVELAELMLRFQVHSAKLWYAGDKHNWPLSSFYLKEILETADEVMESRTGHGDLADKVEKKLLPAVKTVRDSVIAGDAAAFTAAYDDMLSQCNSCHRESGFAFIQLQRPTGADWTNQRFEVDPTAATAPIPIMNGKSPFDND